MTSLTPRLDRVGRTFWRTVGHRVDLGGAQRTAGWIRTLCSTDGFVHSGCYAVRRLPCSDRPSIHVSFPLEQGGSPSACTTGRTGRAEPVGRGSTGSAKIEP